tara:strand:+ start:618 stop:827 length:210 start_codon:yes stop_codon:yes gene_type:complete
VLFNQNLYLMVNPTFTSLLETSAMSKAEIMAALLFDAQNVGLDAVRSTMEFSELSCAEQMAIEDMVQIL